MLCGLLGYYVIELGLTTLSFSVAHAALAGAALGVLLGVDISYTALALTLLYSLFMGALLPRVNKYSDAVSMAFFTVFNALALMLVYLGQTTVLATVRVGGLLWGSVLTATPLKALVLVSALIAFTTYTTLAGSELDAMLFNKKLAEAEGVNVHYHTVLVLLFVGVAVALTLTITGGFLVFSLLYNPVVASAQITTRGHARRNLAAGIGAFSALVGLLLSYYLDLPVGASIAITSTLILASSTLARAVYNRYLQREEAYS